MTTHLLLHFLKEDDHHAQHETVEKPLSVNPEYTDNCHTACG